ncbi:M56 family metallopeptidase [Flavihumibacter profundi]|uniref:M56 family metallopeptidase n=1 Tax=Flavihumibacter profundi TaxID=2716883 RepID=UPI001CC612EA|nr:M56 family metallopeptidase [Flavihumibacter profundi]MBZ5857060.1 hypothetical protein [Flavihumibacter profundi]
MPDILWYVLKVSISLAAVYLFYKLLLGRLTFYQWNRWYLSGYAFVCFFLPLMNIYSWMESHPTGQLFRLVPAMHSRTANAALFQENRWTVFDAFLLVFAAGVVVMLARIAVQFFSLYRMHKRARLLTDEGIKLYEVSHPIIPFSFGMSVFIHPAQHSEAELKDIIRHEMVHVREHHTADIIFSEILVALNWFNPFAWLLRQAIRQNLEFIADRQVLEHGLDRRQYQHLLLKVIGQQQFSIASHLNFSALKTRITMMNKIKSAKVHLIKFLFALPIIAVLLLAFRQDQEPQRTTPDKAVTAMDTLPQLAPAGGKVAINEKGYYLTVADNSGECIVIVKDKSQALVKAILLTDWNKDKDRFEALYGKLIAPRPPAAPAAPAMPGLVEVSLAPPPPPPALAPPPPPPAPKLPENVRSIQVDNKAAKVRLKNGKTETYNLADPTEKAAFEKKYGELPEVPAPVVSRAPSVHITPVPAVGPKATPTPAVKPEEESISIKATSITIVEKNDETEIDPENQPLYFIEGKEATKKDIKALAPEDIAEMTIYKGKMAIEKYGEKGKNGVINISLKKSKKVTLFNPLAILSVGKDKC